MMKMDEDRDEFFEDGMNVHTQTDESPIFFGYVPMESWQSYCFKIKNSLIIFDFWVDYYIFYSHVQSCFGWKLWTYHVLKKQPRDNFLKRQKIFTRLILTRSRSCACTYAFATTPLHYIEKGQKKIGVAQWTQKYYLGEKGTSS